MLKTARQYPPPGASPRGGEAILPHKTKCCVVYGSGATGYGMDLSWMLEEYDGIVYVSDMDSHELLYVNKTGRELFRVD